MTQKLTERFVAHAAPPATGDVTLYDNELTGFGLRASSRRPAGVRSARGPSSSIIVSTVASGD
jgi:hypothetical protein